jgi:cytochrome c oxidase subunit 2
MQRTSFINLTFLLFTILFLTFFNFLAFCDSPEEWQLGFQDPASPIMQGIVELHHDLFFFLILVLGFVFWLLFKILVDFNAKINKTVIKEINYGSIIEIVWTIIPAILLVFVAIPSFTLLYSMDEIIDPVLSLKVVGHQWYWSYEYSDYTSLELGAESSFLFDSYMLLEEDLHLGQFRLLEVDKRVVLPTHTHIRAIITSTDVLHSWAVPSLGIKMDACPGRLNQVSTFINRPGVYYGQCSEICGINHGFMPIVIEAVNFKNYASWVFLKYTEENLV